MDSRERNNEQLGVILNYCKRLDASLAFFGKSFDAFQASTVFQDSCSLCLIQIGEAVNRLSDSFKESNPQIEWHKIYGMRCHLAHAYNMFDAEIAWDAIENYLPSLAAFCEERFDEAL